MVNAVVGGGFTLGKIDTKDLVTQVAESLMKAILIGDLAPGEKLSESFLASQLGISRAPLREAARILETRGLLVSLPRRGFYVRKFNYKNLSDTLELRLLLEEGFFKKAALNLDEDAQHRLRCQIDKMVDVAHEGDSFRNVEEDFLFHKMVCIYAKNQRILKVYEELSDEIRVCISMVGRVYEDPIRAAEKHYLLLDALCSKDPAKCVSAVRDHLISSQGTFMSLFKEKNN